MGSVNKFRAFTIACAKKRKDAGSSTKDLFYHLVRFLSPYPASSPSRSRNLTCVLLLTDKRRRRAARAAHRRVDPLERRARDCRRRRYDRECAVRSILLSPGASARARAPACGGRSCIPEGRGGRSRCWQVGGYGGFECRDVSTTSLHLLWEDSDSDIVEYQKRDAPTPTGIANVHAARTREGKRRSLGWPTV